ncbi:acetate and sugar kinases/Hsc70/actin family protein [Endozoicomonas euniceicola]|uniref:Ppx/GppA phosphatase domain-containing protein n=1 Tax=Endozoicomonas euniceicola TaxID=1234143 RepID=A0ABY6GRY2_9GAMM|nr:hypothetical protein [Endozoicomonas euniceicola]UYM15450.1 hypothetical protein NX720_21780 [Endozoicomonas euniceicola]
MLSTKFASIFAVTCSIAMADYDAVEKKKAAVVNAGSSGSRLFIYQHSSDPKMGLPDIKEDTQNIQNGGIQDVDVSNLDQYLQALFSKVEKENINNIYFYSTAGMRKIKPDQRASINTGIEKWLKEKFPSSDIDVQTITGQQEALYAWLALNYDNKFLALQGDTQGVLDMGGGSTQIAYEVKNKGSYTVKISNKTYSLETKSFLGLGLDLAITQYLNQAACFPKGFPLPNGKKGTGDFEVCSKAIRPLITDVQKVSSYLSLHPVVNTHSFIVISGFYYTAKELNITKNYSIKKLGEQGENFCKQIWEDLKIGETSYLPSPFLWHICFDAALESDLLTLGYRLELAGLPIKTTSSIDYKSDWSLGVLFKPFVTPSAESKQSDSRNEL